LAGGGGGSVATDAIWDTAGDLVQGTGANTAAKLTLGAAGTVVRSTGSTNAYAFPPGHEFDYVAITANVTSTATTEGTATTAITGTSVAYDGSTIVLVEVFSPALILNATAAGQTMVVDLYDGATILGRLAVAITPGAAAMRLPFHGSLRLTPSAASHQFIVKIWGTAATSTVFSADTGGTGKAVAAFLRVTKAT
jgi:hypothetical protein